VPDRQYIEVERDVALEATPVQNIEPIMQYSPSANAAEPSRIRGTVILVHPKGGRTCESHRRSGDL
jgi:hypothetical protein